MVEDITNQIQTSLTPQRLADLLRDSLPECDIYQISNCPDVESAIEHAIRFMHEHHYDNPVAVLRQHGIETLE